MEQEKRLNVNDLSLYTELYEQFKNDRRTRARLRYPWILYGRIVNQMTNGSPVPTPTLKILNVSGVHGQGDKLERYHRKGYRILDYWLPTKEDLPFEQDVVESGWQHRLRNNFNFYKPLEGQIKAFMGEAGKAYELKKREEALSVRENALQNKVDELEKRLSADGNNERSSSRASKKA